MFEDSLLVKYKIVKKLTNVVNIGEQLFEKLLKSIPNIHNHLISVGTCWDGYIMPQQTNLEVGWRIMWKLIIWSNKNSVFSCKFAAILVGTGLYDLKTEKFFHDELEGWNTFHLSPTRAFEVEK